MSDSLRSSSPHAARQNLHERGILLVDDRDFERFTIRAAIEGLTEFHVCGEASNGAEAIEKARELHPDLIVMDLAMPVMNGLEASTVLKNALPDVPIVLLTLYADQVQEAGSAAASVATVLSKADGLASLLACLDRMLGTSGAA